MIREPELVPTLPTTLGHYNRATRVPNQIPTYNVQADSESAQAGLRNAHLWLRLEQRLLRSKTEMGFSALNCRLRL